MILLYGNFYKITHKKFPKQTPKNFKILKIYQNFNDINIK